MKEIRLHGRGEQGVVMGAQMLAYAFVLEGSYASSFPTFGAERRGAPVAAFLRLDENRSARSIRSMSRTVLWSWTLS